MIKKKEKGITLIALVVTIVVLLILAGISISMLTGENGVITHAKLAKESTRGGDVQETIDLTIVDNELKETGKKTKETLVNELYNDGKLTEKEVEELQDTDTIEIGIVTVDFSGLNGDEDEEAESYVGYYADVDGDGTVDGVIYADLAKSVTGNWDAGKGYNYDYSYTSQSNLKKYTISQESYTGDFGTKPVIKATTTEGNDRFYVMALKDVALDGTSTAERNTGWDYYDAEYIVLKSKELAQSMNTKDINDFGQGKSKTQTMITKWNEKGYGTENGGSSYEYVWSIFKNTNNTTGIVDGTKWFVPSIGEWLAFGGNLGVTSSNYANLGLSDRGWSVSLTDKESTNGEFRFAYSVHFVTGHINENAFGCNYFFRLSATF